MTEHLLNCDCTFSQEPCKDLQNLFDIRFDIRLTEIAEEVGKEKKIVHFMSDPDWKLNQGLDKAIEIINKYKNENI